MNLIKLNIKFLLKKATAFVVKFYSLLGFIGILAPLNEPLSRLELALWVNIIISISALIVIWTISFFIVCIIYSKKKRFVIFLGNSGHKLYVQYGDLFSSEEVLNPNERRNIVIPVNRCFDVKVDDRLVSSTTLHGKAFNKLYKTNTYTEESLNGTIQKLLCKREHEKVLFEDKTDGNLDRYAVGTVVDLPGIDNEHYLLWALSTFDKNLKAHTSMEEFAVAVQKLIEACNEESEGFPVLIPLVGTGLSRLEKEQQSILEYLIQAFKVNKQKMNCDIHVVVWENVTEEISIMNLG